MDNLTENQISIMKHTVSDNNRNWFGTSKGNADSNDFDKLVKLGLAKELQPPSWSGDSSLYSLTESGKKIVADIELEEFKNRPKLSRSKQRYNRFLEYGDMFDTFIDFCRWDGEKDRTWNA